MRNSFISLFINYCFILPKSACTAPANYFCSGKSCFWSLCGVLFHRLFVCFLVFLLLMRHQLFGAALKVKMLKNKQTVVVVVDIMPFPSIPHNGWLGTRNHAFHALRQKSKWLYTSLQFLHGNLFVSQFGARLLHDFPQVTFARSHVQTALVALSASVVAACSLAKRTDPTILVTINFRYDIKHLFQRYVDTSSFASLAC